MIPSLTRHHPTGRVPRLLALGALVAGALRTRRAAAGLLTTFALVGGAIGAAYANASSTSCSFTASNGVATLQIIGGGVTQLELDGQTLKWFDATGGSGTCISPGGQVATTANTDSVFFEGTPGIADDFIVSACGGPFSGGISGGTDPSQIETLVFSGSEDTVRVIGSDSTDIIRITGGKDTGQQGGVQLQAFQNANATVKLLHDPKVLRVNGLGGSDLISGSQGAGSGTSMHLGLSGGLGKDQLTGGLLSGDQLQGGDGDDTFFTADGQPGDNITGGAGVDGATIDAGDQAFGVEKLTTATVGALALNPRVVRLGPDGSGRIRLGWKHPKSWKPLRSITLSAHHGNHPVGSITIHPRARTVSAHGALRLLHRPKVTHHGKWVRARLTLKVAPKLAKNGLRLDVTATTTNGKRQVERAAGRLGLAAPR